MSVLSHSHRHHPSSGPWLCSYYEDVWGHFSSSLAASYRIRNSNTFDLFQKIKRFTLRMLMGQAWVEKSMRKSPGANHALSRVTWSICHLSCLCMYGFHFIPSLPFSLFPPSSLLPSISPSSFFPPPALLPSLPPSTSLFPQTTQLWQLNLCTWLTSAPGLLS